jgi:hypothetical protein
MNTAPIPVRESAPAKSNARRTGALLWTCVALFATRVIGQLESVLVAPAWLPDIDAWHSGSLPYPVLLPAQIAVLMLMAVVAWNPRVRGRQFASSHPRAAGALRLVGCAYFLVMAARLVLNILENGAQFWREGAIPVAFNWVLALFVLVAGRRMPAQQQHQDDETDYIPHGDVPALAQPLRHGFGLREQV